MLRKLLIANRGEIACRIIQSAHRLGIASVAVYSEADQYSRHVRLADEAFAIGPAPPTESYLKIRNIIEAAKRSGADSIHPGYGFLSENAEFAAACADAGLIFVGPPVTAIEAMGSKSRAKEIMGAAGVPLLPGYHGVDDDDAVLRSAAENIGYPVLLKAIAGGGGKGMRIVHRDKDFKAELAGARREAQAAFGNSKMLVEKYLAAPRHVEMQIFADKHGEVVHLFDRDCSIQRRHQKIVEEAPAPGLSAALRKSMQDAAVEAARAINYVGAGTVEFLVDGDNFYFMEMNTRLQVEHPVTECITGIDLVEWQCRIAAGEALPLPQNEIVASGHAVEVRLYAEDPDQQFLPASGTIEQLVLPASGNGLRIDHSLQQGDAVSIHYDPMLAKVIGYGDSRHAAIQRTQSALQSIFIGGVTNNVHFLERVLRSNAFADAELSTGFLEKNDLTVRSLPDQDRLALAAVMHWRTLRATSGPASSIWHRADGWRLNLPAKISCNLEIDGEAHHIVITPEPEEPNHCRLALDDAYTVLAAFDGDADDFSVTLDGRRMTPTIFKSVDGHWLALHGDRFFVRPCSRDDEDVDTTLSDGIIRAAMSGRLLELNVCAGETVEKGQALATLEAMKMEHTLAAPGDALVVECRASAGDLVSGGQTLIVLDMNTVE